MTIQARNALAERTRATTGVLVALLVLAVAGIGYYAWGQHVQSRAHALLAEAIGTQEAPITTLGSTSAAGSYANERARLQAAVAKFKAAADAYPSTDAGIYARYQEAVGNVTLGNLAGATERVSGSGSTGPATASTVRWRGSGWPKRKRARDSTIRRSTPTRKWRS